MDIVDCKHFTVGDSFAAAVCDLSPTYKKNEYLDFLRTWGTVCIDDLSCQHIFVSSFTYLGFFFILADKFICAHH